MRLTIRDRDEHGALAFDLSDLLDLLGEDAVRSSWIVSMVECFGPMADAVHELSEAGARVAGVRLVALARGVHQVVDGELCGTLPGQPAPWVLLRAVDSSEWDVETERSDVIARIRARFARVEEAPR